MFFRDALKVYLPSSQVRRQLEYSIAASKGIRIMKAPGTLDAVRDIFQLYGLRGLYLGFRLHFGMTSSLRSSLDAIHLRS